MSSYARVDRFRARTQAVPEDLDVPDLGNPEEPFDFTQQRLPRLLSLLEGPDPVVTTPEQAGVRGHLAREFFQVFLDHHHFFLDLPRAVLRRNLAISWIGRVGALRPRTPVIQREEGCPVAQAAERAPPPMREAAGVQGGPLTP